MNRHLHIICPERPWPADNSVAIDIFYRLKALHKEGIRIHLHYFTTAENGNPTELNQFCETIHLYKVSNGHKAFSFSTPSVVNARINDILIDKLNNDNFPILIEGIACSGILSSINTKNRRIVLRLNKTTQSFQQKPVKTGNKLIQQIKFQFRQKQLEIVEKNLPVTITVACSTETEKNRFEEKKQFQNSCYLPLFTPFTTVDAVEGVGSFCLYHGDLSSPENEEAVIWLLTKVFSKIKVPLVIAGKNPSKRIDKLAHFYLHTCLVANPTSEELNDLIKKAHINVLPSFGNDNSKMKLVSTLFKGRHCVTNPDMVKNTGFEAACHVGNNAAAIASIILQLHHQPFTAEEIKLRERILGTTFSTELLSKQLIQHLY